MKRRIFKLKKLINKPIFIFSIKIGIVLIIIAFFISLIFYIKKNNPPNIKVSKDGKYSYVAKNGIYTASFGEKGTNKANVNFAIDGNEISFTPASAEEKEHKVVKEKESIKFEEIYKDIDFIYYTKPNGIKEDIILKNPVEYKVLPFYLDFKGVEPQYISENIKGKVFYDKDKKYLFHIEKPFAVDKNNSRSDNFDYLIKKDIQTGKYVALLNLDSEWINDKNRQFPITIDPTIVHDTTAEFATGVLNRVKDTGSGSSPTLETYYQELPVDQYTIGLWHLNDASGNALDSSGNSNTLTNTSATVDTTTQILGSAARSFSGGSQYLSNTAITPTLPSDLTVQFWIKTSTLPGVADRLIDIAQSAAVGLQVYISTSGFIGIDNSGGPTSSPQTTTSYADGKWHHIAVTRIGTTYYLYVDANLIGTSGGTAPTYTKVYVARRSDNETYNWQGTMDELKISNVALSTEEIKASASRKPYSTYTSDVIDLSNVSSWNPLTWTEAGVNTGDGETLKDSTSLVAQWNFNGTSGTSATNDAGSCSTSCNGTLSGFDSTASQDADPDSSWTNNNKRWGAGALQFDGTDSYVDVGNNAAVQITGNTLTVETWTKPTANGEASGAIISKVDVGSPFGGYQIGYSATNTLNFFVGNSTTWQGVSSLTTYNPGQWYHVVGVYDSTNSTIKLYVNGKLENTASATGAIRNASNNLLIGKNGAGAIYYQGVIDSTRIYSRALDSREIMSNYQAGNIELQTRVGSDTSPDDGSWSDWSPTTGETAIENFDSNPNPEYFTVALLHGDNQDATTVVADSSLIPKTITVAGNAQIDTAQSKFGGSSVLFDGTGDYLSIPDSSDTYFNGDFTIDMWTRFNALSHAVFYDQLVDANNEILLYYNNTDNRIYFYHYTGAAYQLRFYVPWTPSTSTWYHIALVRNGNTWDIYIDGVAGTKTLQNGAYAFTYSDLSAASTINIATAGYLNGWIDEARITKGKAIWTSNFTPPTSAYDSITQIESGTDSVVKVENTGSNKLTNGRAKLDGSTVGLWHLDETGGSGAYIKDSTANANHGTPTGTSPAQGMSGKSRSFNGSSDLVSLSSSTGLINVQNDYSVEAWIYPTNTSSVDVYSQGNSGNNNPDFEFYVGSGNLSYYVRNDAGTSITNSVAGISTNKWNHIAFTKTGTTHILYINGSATSFTSTTPSNPITFTNTTLGASIRTSTNGYFPGKIDEVRISNTARSADEIAESYRAGRDHYIGKTISSTDLSGKSTLPFYVAADRPGSYLSATIGESLFANYQPDSSTLALWNFNEQSGSGAYLKDSSGNSLHGTPTGTSFVQAKISKGRSFAGSTDLVDLGSSSRFGGLTSFTISAWIYPVSVTGEHRIFDRGSAGNPNTILFYQSGTSLAMLVNNTDSLSYAGLTANTWHHVAVVFSGSGGEEALYINGQKVATRTTTQASPTAGSINTRIGCIANWTACSSTYAYSGTIDEVRVDNIVRTATEIRQAYEIGLRTHPITIDFGAKLDSGNLIADSSDLGFTVDATYYGLNQKGDALYKGDKIIIRENIGGTDYIAQGTVTAVTASTGATTVSSWDSGSTFPAGGYTANASVFKWQREYWNINGEVQDGSIDAVTNLTLRLTDGNEGRTIWIDDLKSNSDYLTNPSGSTITSSTGSRYVQYRAVLSSFDEAVTATLSGVTIDYLSNAVPTTPSLDLPTDTATGQALSTVLKTTSTDSDSDYLRYKIQLCTNLGMTTGCQTFDQTSSQTGWSGQNAQTSTAYTSGTQATYTIQTPLSSGTTYYWRSYAIDPAGSNTWSSTQTPYSFTTNFVPNTPSLDLPSNTATGEPITTIFKTTSTDSDSDYLRYKIQVCTNLIMTTGCQTFDQTSSQTGWSGQNAQTSTAYTSGTQATYTVTSNLAFNTTYYWRSYATDPAGSNTWSSTQTPYSFTTVTNSSPQAPTGLLIEGEANPIMVTDLTPEFSAICNESDVIDTLTKYRIQVDTTTSFVSPVWDSGAAGTAMTACNPGSRSVDISYAGSALSLDGAIYHWRIKFWDNNGAEGAWSNDNPFFKMDNPNDGRPSNCRVTETPNDTSLTLKWDDNSSSETQFRIEKNVNGGGYVFLTNKAPNSTSNLDSSISPSNTYQYRIRSEGSSNSNWCETTVFSLLEGNFLLKGLNFKGLNIR